MSFTAFVALFALLATDLASAQPACQLCSLPCLGNCCPQTGRCPSSSCVANGFGSNERNCNENSCRGATCSRSTFNTSCGGSDKCLGRVTCTTPGCDYANELCVYDGSSTNFKVCLGVTNCAVSAWGSWGPCVSGFRFRTRTVVSPASNGGISCPTLREQETCNDLLEDSGCGPQLLTYHCTLNTSRPTTVCMLPNGLGSLVVPNLPGYSKMRFRVNARGEYKP